MSMCNRNYYHTILTTKKRKEKKKEKERNGGEQSITALVGMGLVKKSLKIQKCGDNNFGCCAFGIIISI